MIAIGSDHGGYKLKEAIKAHFSKNGREFTDFGTSSEESVDYAPIAQKAAEMVAAKEADFGILICTTGIGVCMAANKVRGIRAATCTNEYTAEMTRKHNNANILCMGQKVVDESLAIKMVDIFLKTEFEGGRHQRRVNEIMEIENNK